MERKKTKKKRLMRLLRCMYLHLIWGLSSILVEHSVCTREVSGSNPLGSRIASLSCDLKNISHDSSTGKAKRMGIRFVFGFSRQRMGSLTKNPITAYTGS